MGQVTTQMLPAHQVEYMRNNASQKRWYMELNENFGYAFAGLGEAVRPSVLPRTVKLLYGVGYLSVRKNMKKKYYSI